MTAGVFFVDHTEPGLYHCGGHLAVIQECAQCPSHLCAIGNAQGSSTIAVPAAGSATIQLPTIKGGAGKALPVTGGLTGRYYAVALLITLGAVAFGRRGFKALMGTKG